jgi:hypothetical protein
LEARLWKSLPSIIVIEISFLVTFPISLGYIMHGMLPWFSVRFPYAPFPRSPLAEDMSASISGVM